MNRFVGLQLAIIRLRYQKFIGKKSFKPIGKKFQPHSLPAKSLRLVASCVRQF
jgi:hypothetical protein